MPDVPCMVRMVQSRTVRLHKCCELLLAWVIDIIRHTGHIFVQQHLGPAGRCNTLSNLSG